MAEKKDLGGLTSGTVSMKVAKHALQIVKLTDMDNNLPARVYPKFGGFNFTHFGPNALYIYDVKATIDGADKNATLIPVLTTGLSVVQKNNDGKLDSCKGSIEFKGLKIRLPINCVDEQKKTDVLHFEVFQKKLLGTSVIGEAFFDLTNLKIEQKANLTSELAKEAKKVGSCSVYVQAVKDDFGVGRDYEDAAFFSKMVGTVVVHAPRKHDVLKCTCADCKEWRELDWKGKGYEKTWPWEYIKYFKEEQKTEYLKYFKNFAWVDFAKNTKDPLWSKEYVRDQLKELFGQMYTKEGIADYLEMVMSGQL